MKRKVLGIVAVTIFMCEVAAWGGVPRRINYEGYLTDPAGAAVTGTLEMTFSIWDQVDGGTQLWGETQPSVSVTDGAFSIILGSVVPIPTNVCTGASRWLQTQIGEEILSPRREIVSLAYAFRAEHADTADYARNAAVGAGWGLTGNSGTTSGTHFLGTTDDQAMEIKVNNIRALRLEPDVTANNSPNLIGGYTGNSVAPAIEGAVIGGGGYADAINRVTGLYGTVSGGTGNTASNTAVVGGGAGNTASGYGATVSGGSGNTASGSGATVSGGKGNTASGFMSVAAGYKNIAQGDYSFAAGENAKANHNSAFVWSDGDFASVLFGDVFTSTGDGQFLIHASGGVGINTNWPGTYDLAVNGSAAKTGGGSWSTFSDRRLKAIQGTYERGLEEITRLNTLRYRYTEDNALGLPSDGEFVGVVAQDVQEVIPESVEEGSDGYLMVNNDAIIWAMVNAIKELKAENEALRGRVEVLERRGDAVTR